MAPEPELFPPSPSAQPDGCSSLSRSGPEAPGQGLWHPSGREACQHFSSPTPSAMLQRQSSWWAHPRGQRLPSSTPSPLLGWRLLMHVHSRQRTQGPCCPCLCLFIGQRFGAERQAEKSRAYHPCPAPLRGKQSGHKDRELWNSPQRNWLYLEHSVGKFRLKNAPENNDDLGDKRLREGW